jgi:hypothetical protein
LTSVFCRRSSLCAVRRRGDVFPFMADEALEAIPSIGERDYKLPTYLKFQVRPRAVVI